MVLVPYQPPGSMEPRPCYVQAETSWGRPTVFSESTESVFRTGRKIQYMEGRHVHSWLYVNMFMDKHTCTYRMMLIFRDFRKYWTVREIYFSKNFDGHSSIYEQHAHSRNYFKEISKNSNLRKLDLQNISAIWYCESMCVCVWYMYVLLSHVNLTVQWQSFAGFDSSEWQTEFDN